MKILYFTDIHGNIKKYQRLEKISKELNIDIVINGGDILPNIDYIGKKGYIDRYFQRHFEFFNCHKIPYIYCLGNDDYLGIEEYLTQITSKFEHVHNVAFRHIKVKGIEFIGMNWVPDYPFRLKDYCHMDTKDFNIPAQNGSPLFSTKVQVGDIVSQPLVSQNPIYQIREDWFDYVSQIPTIEEGLKTLVRPQTESNTIYLMHTPPYGTGLGIVDGFDVGSKAVMNFIMDRQPLMTLHGHIHHSYIASGVWQLQMDKTLAIQPGQTESVLTYVVVEIENGKIVKSEIKLETGR